MACQFLSATKRSQVSFFCYDARTDPNIFVCPTSSFARTDPNTFVLPVRLAKFSLRLAEEKNALVKFNRWERDDSGKFTFLGFDFYWARTRRNREHKMVRRRTSKKKYRGALAAMKKWIREARSWPLKMILSSLRRKLRGYWNYYSVIGNSSMTWRYYSAVKKLVFKWLNRRSQRKSYTWGKFLELFLGEWQNPAPRCVEQVPSARRQSQFDPA